MALAAIAAFVAVFTIASLRNIHLGVLMLPAACAAGVWLAGMPLREVFAGFPVAIMVLLIGVTYLFGIAQSNGTIDQVIGRLLRGVGERRHVLPFVFFLMTAGVAALGSPQGGYVLIPMAMAMAHRAGVDPVVMAVAINAGIAGGGMAPTSLFGIVTNGAARQAGIDLNPFTLLAAALVANIILLFAASRLFRGSTGGAGAAESIATAPPLEHPFSAQHIITLGSIAGLVVAVLAGCGSAPSRTSA